MTTERLSVSSSKAAIRGAALARRDALPPELRREYARRIIDRVLALESFGRARSVLAYSSFGSEPDTAPLLAAALDSGKRLLLPRINRAENRLEVHEVPDLATSLRAGVWNILEPDPDLCAVCTPEQIDFILVPGAAFDRRGGRLGYGRGYYDKLLACCASAATKIAGAFEVQVVDDIPMEAHDIAIDALITETGTWRAGRKVE
jgi:5,10-methenyltetrahydrofolate synthetase